MAAEWVGLASREFEGISVVQNCAKTRVEAANSASAPSKVVRLHTGTNAQTQTYTEGLSARRYEVGASGGEAT